MIKRFYILLLAIVASVGMSFAQASIVSSGTKGGMSYTFYDNGLLEISGSGALPGRAFTNWDGGFGTSVKNIRFAEGCEVYGLNDMWFGCYTETSHLETVEINSVVPIMFSGTSGAGIFYKQDGAVTITITAPGIVDAENQIIDNYGSPVNMIFNMPATTVFERKWFSGLRNYFAVTIPTGAKGHIPAGYSFTDPYDQKDYDDMVAHGMEDLFWESHSHLEEGKDYILGVESTFEITAENASQIFGQATVSFQAPTEASNSEWVLWRKSDLKEFPDMSSGNQKVCKDVTVKVNNGVYNTDSGFGIHFDSSDEDGVQFVAPEGKVFKRIVILNEYGTFSDPNWSYDGNYKKWSGSANIVGFEGDICGISLIEFEVEASAPANSCGGGLTWELNNGELVISYDGEGTGVMNDYDIPNDNPAPWYANRENITSVSLPEGIKTIGKDAFRDCVNLTTVTIPNSVTTIGESAFVSVEHLETVTIGTGITSIVNGAFYGNAELTTVTCSATTPPSIGAMVFDECTKLTHIYVPAASVDAYKSAWSDYASLISAPPANSITINGTPQVGDNSISLTYYFDPGNVPGLDDGFAPTLKVKCVTDNKWDEKWLSSSEISSGTTTIILEELVSFEEGKSYDVCFAYNNGDWVDDVFQSFSFPATPANACGDGLIWELNDGALTISYTGTGTGVMDNYASASDAPWYSYKDDITSVTITDGVKSVGSYSFGYYGNLVTVTIGNDVETIGEYAFGDCYKFTTLNLGNSVKHIGNRAFMWAKVLTGFTLPSTLETIGDRAFLQNKLITSLTIPSNVTSIGLSAFMYCAALTSVTVEATTPPTLGATVFDGVPTSSIPLHVPSGSVAAYTAADQWKDFDIQDPTPAYEKAMNLINAIGTVELTAECKAKIDAAREAYDALSDGDKDLVTNSATLTTAEAAFENVMNIWLSGDCDVILWKDTTLTVRKHAGEGNGAMADYNYASRAPWYSGHWYDPKPNDIVIKSVTVEEGVTHLGDYAFAWMSEMKTATIPSSVTTIPKDAFYWSKAVDDIYLTVADPSNLTWTLPNTADVQFKPSKATLCHVPADLLTAYQETFGTLNMTFVGNLDPITPLTPEQQQALDAAKGLINAIPSPVVYTPACKEAIDAARAAYDALTPDMLKQLVSNYATLTAAEATYANLEDVAVAEAKIAAIPQPVKLKLATRDSIESARAAYEALTADQKLLVGNYAILEAAEAAWAGLINVAPAGALSGKYTINDGGDVIYFAHGNLQYTRENLDADWSTGTFRLATNQYDRIELVKTYPDAYCTDNYGDKTAVGLFGWGTWGEGKTPNLTSWDRTLYTWSTDFSGTLEGTSTWRTLTKDEWVYLLTHNNQSYATVHGVNGLLVAPDGKDIEGKSMTAWVEINDETWTMMQNDGYLFLPACGQRSQLSGANITTGGQGEEVLYYSSTEYNDTYAYNIWYTPGSQTIDDHSNKRQAFGIRLVSAGVNPLDQVQVVKGLIDDIPAEITLDAACVNAIQAARTAYDALDNDAKDILAAADVDKLTDAEQALKDLNQAVADEVIAKINNIPTPVELKLATRDSIESARAAYDALNAAQQALVSNYTKLTNAETELASLNPGVPPATPLDSAQAVKGLIGTIRETLDATEACGAEIAAALNAYDALSDAAKGALDAADVQKLNDAATRYPALDAIAAIEAIPDEITYDPMTKSYIEIAKGKYDALSDASKALVNTEDVQKLTNALEAWATLAAKIEHNVSYIGKDGELKNEKVALLHIPDPAPDFNGYEFVRWDVKGGDFLEEGLRIKAVYTPIITTNPAAYDTLVYNGTAQTLVAEGVAKEGHIEYRINDGEWSAELPQATFAAAYVVYYKLVREGHDDYMAGSVNVTIAKAPVTYTAPTAVDTLVYNASNQTLIAAGQTNDGTFEYTLAPNVAESWSTDLPQAKDAGTYSVYYRVQGDLNHLDSTAVDPIAVTIAKAELTATADNKAIIFGELAPQFTVTYAGWQGDDDASDLTGDIAYTTPYIRGNNVGEYTITPSGLEAANYTINFVDGTLTVNRKSAESSDIMAAQEDDEQLVYTNAVNKPTILVKDTTLTLTEEKDYTLTFVGRGETEYIESATAPTHVGEYTAKIEFIGNYKDMLTVDFTISKAELTITADDKENIFGEEAPEFTVSYEGFLGTDTKDVLTGSQAYACEYKRGDNVGDDYTIIPSGVDAHDYVITFVNGTLTVNRKSAKDADIVAAQLAGEALVYDAEVNRPTIVVTDTTLTLTEDKDYVLTFIGTANDASVYEESAVAPTKAGDYTAIVAFVGNYIDTLTVDFTVSKAPLTITADDKEMIYGDEHPEFTVSYDGFLGTDDNSVLLGTQGYSCDYAPGSYIGTYAITPKDVEAYDYAITFVDGTLTVNKAVVKVVGAEAQIAKIEDGNTDAVVLNAGQLEGIKLNDAVGHETTASFSDATVGENKTITLFYELTGDAALLANYDLIPTSNIFTAEGVIIEDFIPAEEGETEKEDEEAQIEEGIEVYAYGYCLDDHVYMRYHLNRGNPDQYKIEFADNRFTDVNYGDYTISGPDGTIEINIPVDMPTGDYQMTVTFRDSRFDWLESNPFTVTFHVNLPETYVKPLFENTIVLVDTCNCFTDIQWYHRADASEAWQPIAGATGHYYRPEGGAKLTGEFFVKASMNGEPTYTCGQTDMETLYGADKQQPKATVKAFPNPVVNSTTVTIENSENWNHSLRVVNTVGIEMFHTTFEGNETELRMDGFVQGNYMISVDGIVVKVMKK